MGKNVIMNARIFQNKLRIVMNGIYEFIELLSELKLSSVGEDGITRYLEESGKTCFQVSGQFNRPTEFLEVLLDIIRVNFEPYVLGTFFLNSNMEFIYENLPNSEFQLGYITALSEEGQEFSEFWDKVVVPRVKECGYSFSKASTLFVVVSTGEENYGVNLLEDVSKKLSSGFSANEAFDLITSIINTDVERPRKRFYTGYCLDPVLGAKIRLSAWICILENKERIH